jgi:hypothetical protein
MSAENEHEKSNKWSRVRIPGVNTTYDHNFERFSPIFGEKIGVFS